MRRYFSILCALLACSTAAPAFADDETMGDDVANAVALTTARTAKFALGFTVGLPFAVLRKTLRNTSDTTKKVTNDSDNNAVNIVTEALVLPFGAVVGSAEAIGWAASNSWKNREEDKPFNKEMFSLGELD